MASATEMRDDTGAGWAGLRPIVLGSSTHNDPGTGRARLVYTDLLACPRYATPSTDFERALNSLPGRSLALLGSVGIPVKYEVRSGEGVRLRFDLLRLHSEAQLKHRRR